MFDMHDLNNLYEELMRMIKEEGERKGLRIIAEVDYDTMKEVYPRFTRLNEIVQKVLFERVDDVFIRSTTLYSALRNKVVLFDSVLPSILAIENAKNPNEMTIAFMENFYESLIVARKLASILLDEELDEEFFQDIREEAFDIIRPLLDEAVNIFFNEETKGGDIQ